MTRKEAIYCLTSYQPDSPDGMCYKCKYYGTVKEEGGYTCASAEARRMAIKALERELVLEDIKAEMTRFKNNRTEEAIKAIDLCLSIIDKHISGKETE